jgi:FKBP-type peptidyl-prolyl cis-trans isomerase
MHVDGKFVNGTSLNPTYKRGKPLQFRIGKGQAFKCWDEVGLNMNRGQKVQVLCPSDTM